MAGPQPSTGTVCLIVPSGAAPVSALARAVSSSDPAASVAAVWCGDPHLRPVLDPADGVAWCDADLAAPVGAGWNRLLVAMPARAYEWARAAMSARRLLAAGRGPVVVLRAGSVAVAGPVLESTGDAAAVSLVPRCRAMLPSDGLWPSERDLVSRGSWSTAIAAFAAGAEESLVWFASALTSCEGDVGPWFDRLASVARATPIDSAFVGGWSPSTAVEDWAAVRLVDLDDLDPSHPWVFGGSRPARHRLSTDAPLAQLVGAVQPQVSASSDAPVHGELCLPGGVAVDDAMRAVVRQAVVGVAGQEQPPEPFTGSHSLFVRWLEGSDPGDADLGRYWDELAQRRGDLAAAFPKFRSLDTARYVEWIDHAWPVDHRSVILRATSRRHTPLVSHGDDPFGVNVLGYLAFDQSLGHVARQIIGAFEAAGIPVARLNHDRAMRSALIEAAPSDGEARYHTNLIVVTADQLEFVQAEHGATVLAGRRNIGFWFWELEHVPPWMVRVAAQLDEVWAASSFVAQALARSLPASTTVRHVPLYLPAPRPSARTRGDLGLPADRFLFLTAFDQHSVPERKNPFGVIEAFTSAFAENEGPMLVVKTTNGDRAWINHERLLLAAAGRSDIVCWDEHLSRADQMAVVQAADCFVSLHHSEGLGLHCAEAMWLGKPVIATRYSGNLDFMDDSCSALIDFRLVPVTHGDGIYPAAARWAAPDLDQAAHWMRRIAGEPELARTLGRRGRERMESQPSLRETGLAMARAAGLVPGPPAGT